jgi:enoyl-CoA hydratase/carnithine racemase
VDRTTVDVAPVAGVRLDRPRDGVTLLTIDRPERYNALDESILLGLTRLVDALADDPATRVMVVCGAGPAFSAGGDLELLRKVAGASVEDGGRFLTRALQAAAALRRLPQPTIAALNGPVAGAGLGLALGCDIRIASPTATLSAPFIHMGLVPEMGLTWLLPRLVGFGVAVELLLTGRQVEAAEAQRLGLIARICEDPLGSALAMAAAFAAMPPRAVAVTKTLLQQALAGELESAIAAEAREQAAAVHGPEFGDRYGAWCAVTPGRSEDGS